MSYIGSKTLSETEIKRFSVTGSTSTTHTLTWSPPNEQSLIITINGIKQQDSAYTISGTTLTLSEALIASDEMEVIGILDIGKSFIPGTNSITSSAIQDGAITSTKLSVDEDWGLVTGSTDLNDLDFGSIV
jgi:hypothetical protein